MSDEALDVRPWEPGEPWAPEALAPNAREGDSAFALREERHWDWALRDNPAGARLFLARRAGRVVARFGALPVRTRFFGETRHFAQLLESHALPEERNREGLVALARAFHEAHARSDGDLVYYGWPNAPDRALVKRELDYELLRATALLVRELGAGPSVLPEGTDELARFEPEVNVLYDCCATHWHASAIRDTAFLNWRFVDTPLAAYRRLAVSGEGIMRGYAVVRQGSALHPGLALLMDWLVLPGDEEASERLLEAALACARAQGAEALALALPEWSPWSLYFQERGFLHHPTENLMHVHGSAARFDMLWLRDNWWTTLADALIL